MKFVKITKKIIENIFEDFKDDLFISKALENHKIRPYDFFEYLRQNPWANEQYNNIEKANNFIKEEQIAEKVFNGEYSKTILLEMIKANNKKKYTQKIEIEDTTAIGSLSDDDLKDKIAQYYNKIYKQ